MGEAAFLRKEEHINWLFRAKWSALKAYGQVALYELNRLYLRTYMFIHMHAITISQKERL